MLGVSPIDTGEGANHLAFHVILKKLLLKNFGVDCGICLLLVSAGLGICISRSQLSRPRLFRNTPLHSRAYTQCTAIRLIQENAKINTLPYALKDGYPSIIWCVCFLNILPDRIDSKR
jgi:hypothetical protein